MAGQKPHIANIPSDNALDKVLAQNAEQVNGLISRYKYHVIRTAMGKDNKKQLSLVKDVRNKDGQTLLAKGVAQTESSLRRYISKLLKHSLEHPIEYYIDVIQPEAAEAR